MHARGDGIGSPLAMNRLAPVDLGAASAVALKPLRPGGYRLARRWLVGLCALVCLVVTPAPATASSPAVSTGSAAGVTSSAAKLTGTVNPGGRGTRFAFQFGRTTAYGSQTRSAAAGSGRKGVAVNARLTGLRSGTAYHYRLIATNASGTSAGADRAFRTAGSPPPPPPPPPTVLTGSATSSPHGADLSGVVNPNGHPAGYYFQFGLTALYGLQTAPAGLPAIGLPQPVRFAISGLQSHRVYHYRLVASGAGGTSVGADQVFITGRVRPRLLSARTRPRRLRSRPYVLTTRGRLHIPSGFPPLQSCSGVVRIRYTSAGRTLATVRVPLTAQCGYRASVRITRRAHRGQLRVAARFLGNTLLRSRSARSRLIRVG